MRKKGRGSGERFRTELAGLMYTDAKMEILSAMGMLRQVLHVPSSNQNKRQFQISAPRNLVTVRAPISIPFARPAQKKGVCTAVSARSAQSNNVVSA